MASPTLINPKTALLLAPLISSSCSLWFASDQHLFLSVFTQPLVRKHDSNALIPHYFRAFFGSGLPRVVTLLGITTWASIGAIYVARPLLEAKGSLWWYTAAAGLAVGHLGFVPGVIPPIKELVDEANRVEKEEDGGGGGKAVEEKSVSALERWLRVNFVRMVTTDLGAWICAVVAVAKTFNIEE